MAILITKASGEQEFFSESKLRRSLSRTHARPEVISEVIETVKKKLISGMSTHDIYHAAFELLKNHNIISASRYQLKRALMALGPDGHYFEQFVGELLKVQDFRVAVAKTISGVCVSHEVDVIAVTSSRYVFVECKLHNHPGFKSDVKVALYIQARFEDIYNYCKHDPEHAGKSHEIWLVTNTALTSDAIKYAECKGMRALSWNYPPDNSLSIQIELYRLYPITCLVSLKDDQKRKLLKKGIILCRQLYANVAVLNELHLSSFDRENLQSELLGMSGPGGLEHERSS